MRNEKVGAAHRVSGSQRGECAGGGTSTLRRLSVARCAVFLAFLASLAPIAAAQTNVKRYYVNDGRSNTYEADAAETQVDLGGFIPYQRYDEVGTSGHHYAVPYNPTFGNFLDLVKKYGLDLYEFDSRIDATLGAAEGVLPFNTALQTRAEIDTDLTSLISSGGATSFPVVAQAWWNCTGTNGVPGAGKRKVLMWPYKLNGGPVMICMAADDLLKP